MNEESMRDYANVLISAVNLQEGQCLRVKCEPVHWEFVNVLGGEAYRRGAKYVQVDAEHRGLYRARIQESREEHLAYVPESRRAVVDDYISNNWALISLVGNEDPDALATVDPRRNGVVSRAISQINDPLRRATQADLLRWVVAPVPTAGWGAKVFGTSANADAKDRLWSVLRPILRLDHDDPIRAWADHGQELVARQNALRELELDAVRFTGPGTDLTVGLPEGSLWMGGGSTSPDGRFFLPNLPTEEVFTAPDFRRTTGTVAITRPALILGRLVTGARFRFEDGRMVECSAESGQETLEQFFEVDEGSRYLGEVALVDTLSPIFQSGLVFHNTLLDENAACHIAFGSAYPGCIPGGDEMDDETFRRSGGNRSVQHADVMIGGPEVAVSGERKGGGSVDIIRDGLWKLS
jgi:aminopeptidase